MSLFITSNVAAETTTMGFVLTYKHYALYETEEGRNECPAGFSASQLESWETQFPTKQQRKTHIQTYRSVLNRGENGENVLLHPNSRRDPQGLLKQAQGGTAYGFDLDGVPGSEENAASCPHHEFADPQGNSGIDNQLYRVIGCVPFFRSGGLSPVFSEKYLLETPGMRVLMEVGKVDDELNDEEVEVVFYRSQNNPIRLDASGQAIPWQSFKIDISTPAEHIYRAKGKIENGVLTTEPIDFWYAGSTVEHIKDMRLHLTISATQAEGLMGGYWDLQQLVEGSYLITAAGGPAMYDALYRLADGHRDANTGQCTAISSAQEVRFSRAHLVRPAKDQETHQMQTVPEVVYKMEVAELGSLQTPPEVGVRLTDEGPVFVDANGMTLYKSSMDSTSGTIQSNCTNRPEQTLRAVTRLGSNLGFEVRLPDAKTRKSCAQKRPPLLAGQNAKSVGKWVAFKRDDGSQQWAYDGAPLYTSVKDQKPGDTNGAYYGTDRFNARYSWSVALAPVAGLPPGITAQKSSIGVVLASHNGKTLYVLDQDKVPGAIGCQGDCTRKWQPLQAPAAAADVEHANWSVTKRTDGVNQWVYRDKPIYTYEDDHFLSDISVLGTVTVFGDSYGEPIPGRRPLTLKPAPKHPDDITVQAIYYGKYNRFKPERVYADTEGNTLYTFHCAENTEDRLDCDDVGDNPVYWQSFCGPNCADLWRPFIASADVAPTGNTWSVITIHPNNPWQPVAAGEAGISVWAYKGRPVYTYAKDSKQARLNGAKENLMPSISAISAYAE